MTQISFPRTLYPDFERKCIDSGLPDPGIEGTETVTTATWTPDLTAGQLVTAQDIVASLGTGMDLALYQSIKAQIPTLKTYVGIANPTAAQTANATKAIIRVLRAIIKDA